MNLTVTIRPDYKPVYSSLLVYVVLGIVYVQLAGEIARFDICHCLYLEKTNRTGREYNKQAEAYDDRARGNKIHGAIAPAGRKAGLAY